MSVIMTSCIQDDHFVLFSFIAMHPFARIVLVPVFIYTSFIISVIVLPTAGQTKLHSFTMKKTTEISYQ